MTHTHADRPAEARPLYIIAHEIMGDWTKPFFGAVPYLQAMFSLNSVSDYYGLEDGEMIVAYFLANARTWRGDTARRVKAELQAMLPDGFGGWGGSPPDPPFGVSTTVSG